MTEHFVWEDGLARLAQIVRAHPGMWPTFSFRLLGMHAEGQFRLLRSAFAWL
jgi:hypothetical protein